MTGEVKREKEFFQDGRTVKEVHLNPSLTAARHEGMFHLAIQKEQGDRMARLSLRQRGGGNQFRKPAPIGPTASHEVNQPFCVRCPC